MDLLKLPSSFEKTIARDIARTYPKHEMFKVTWGEGQENLYNVAKAYSVYDRDVGYCQGSSFIIGLLLMHMPEEDAFEVFARLMVSSSYNLRELFKPSMAALGLRLFQLEHLIMDHLPEIHSTFSCLGIELSMFASSWFLAMFATTLPLDLVKRSFDALLCFGEEVIFRLGLALLKVNADVILSLDMDSMVQYLQVSAFA
ncbi:hypothetical protein HELRODRAFT_116521 [Helobdella robusta]|uniref:Rab-GAP TBC domain-containing protein n=1 Tax=Helobdella robusta TaxID=6412 RepID=T1EGF5_HELRO|nr:hypothetical protein HELRODRAFT_116521 [Helobdella robusta]ESN90261.1 hypothetical protein HELRODRAFT_116521 [Helobdella robusta]